MEKNSFAVFFLFFFLCSSGFVKPLEYQTLDSWHRLPKPPTQYAGQLTWSKTLTLTQTQGSSSSELNPNSLYIRLQHRDSIAVNSTPEKLFKFRLQRDSVRVQTLNKLVRIKTASKPTKTANLTVEDFSSSIISGLPQGSGEYFTRIGIGTPPRNLYMVLDTGSDIVWLQCSPCRRCYSQTDPVFNPVASRSFSGVPCTSPLCRRLDVSGCGRRSSCLYQVSYGDGSFTVGELSTETLTFRGTSIGKVALGCGHDNEGLFVGAAGLLGLGRGGLSFPSQTGRQFGEKFSYCLVNRQSSAKSSSWMIFGESAVPRTAVFTPMLRNPKLDTFYYVELVGISVGGARVSSVDASDFLLDATGNGGVIIDSGTSVTRLVQSAYVAVRDAFRSGARNVRRAAGYSLFDTCFDLSGKDVVKVPTVVLHFAGGADVSLPATNYLIPVDRNGIFCFAFAGTVNRLSIIGNIQQQGFRVVFDKAGSRVGFAPRGCT